MAGRNDPRNRFQLNPVTGYMPRDAMSWEQIKDESRSKKSKQRGRHNTGGYSLQEIADPVLTMGSAIASAVPAGLVGTGIGLLDAARGGEAPMEAAFRAQRGVEAQLTYKPRTVRRQENLQSIAGGLAPIMQPFEGRPDTLMHQETLKAG